MFSLRDWKDPDVHDANFGVSTTRGNLGNWYTLQFNSSPVFMYITISIHIPGSVLKRAIAWDRV